MSIQYPKKAKTQGHLRKIMTEEYKMTGNALKIGEKLQVSAKTVRRRGEAKNLENLSSAPKIPARKYELRDLCMVYWLYEKDNLKGDEILDYFEENEICNIKRSTIYYYLKIWGLTKRKKDAKKRINQQFKDYDPGFIHVDITYGPKLNGKKWYIYVAIDRATRLIYLEIHDNKRADTAASFLEKAIEFFPFHTEKVLTDNGKEFTLKNHKGNSELDLTGAFDLVCETYNIDHRTTRPYTPQTNGMVEKSNDTIKSNTLKVNEYQNVEEMNKDLILFMVYYNLERRHTSLRKELGVKTPYNALEYWYEKNSSIFKEDLFDFRDKLLTMKKNL